MLAPLAAVRRDVEVRELQSALAPRAHEGDLGVVRDERRHEVGWGDRDAVLCAEDRVQPVLALHREAFRSALEPAHRRLVAEVPAPVPLQQVAADGPHRAELERRGVAQRLAQDRHSARERLGGLELDERRERADAQTLSLFAGPATQALDAGEIDEELRLLEPVLHEPEEVRAAGERGRAVPQQAQPVGQRARADVRERVQSRTPASASASRTRARVSGECRTRAPLAFATAFAMAAAVGMIGGSPRPFAPRLFARRSGLPTNFTTIFGTSL